MESFASLTTLFSLASLVLSIYVCVRLLMAAQRTRGAAEIAMGTYQLMIVGAILVYWVLRILVARERVEHVFQVAVFANLLIALGVVAMAVGIWRIYRASSQWAAVLCGVLSVVVLAGWAWTSVGNVLPITAATTPSNTFFVSGRSAVYLWGGIEGLRYSMLMRKRVALGLGDPIIAHQIMLWGFFSLTMGSLAVCTLSAGYILGDAYDGSAASLFITPVASLVASICLWLGFFPPASYRRMIGGQEAKTAA